MIVVTLRVVSLVCALQEDVCQLSNGTRADGQSLDWLSGKIHDFVRNVVVLADIGQKHASQVCQNVGFGLKGLTGK